MIGCNHDLEVDLLTLSVGFGDDPLAVFPSRLVVPRLGLLERVATDTTLPTVRAPLVLMIYKGREVLLGNGNFHNPSEDFKLSSGGLQALTDVIR